MQQIWILHSLESPFYSGKVIQQTSVNWTASYRLDSDLVTPYDKWVYYNENRKVTNLGKNYAEGKTKKVAWIVSNCQSNNKRLEYAKELGKYISVDIYGACGDKVCSRNFENSCHNVISKNYKFYLSFENANCRDYITEKFYWNALRFDLIPVVMGAPKEDYEKVAPYNSFIHVEDFSSPKELAEYLRYLDKNDDSYNSFFLWKNAGEFVNTYFMCRLCAMLHAERGIHYYQKISHWWRKPGICTRGFWSNTNKGLSDFSMSPVVALEKARSELGGHEKDSGSTSAKVPPKLRVSMVLCRLLNLEGLSTRRDRTVGASVLRRGLLRRENPKDDRSRRREILAENHPRPTVAGWRTLQAVDLRFRDWLSQILTDLQGQANPDRERVFRCFPKQYFEMPESHSTEMILFH